MKLAFVPGQQPLTHKLVPLKALELCIRCQTQTFEPRIAREALHDFALPSVREWTVTKVMAEGCDREVANGVFGGPHKFNEGISRCLLQVTPKLDGQVSCSQAVNETRVLGTW